jgi:two-component system chemotaxis sensor kinase CheA
VPLSSVSEALILSEREVRRIEGREILTLRGRSLPLVRLHELFSLEALPTQERRYVVVASIGSRRLGLIVDHLIGQQDIVIKALGKTLASVRGFAGATELGDQRVCLVLDAASLMDEAGAGDTLAFAGRFAHG